MIAGLLVRVDKILTVHSRDCSQDLSPNTLGAPCGTRRTGQYGSLLTLWLLSSERYSRSAFAKHWEYRWPMKLASTCYNVEREVWRLVLLRTYLLARYQLIKIITCGYWCLCRRCDRDPYMYHTIRHAIAATQNNMTNRQDKDSLITPKRSYPF